MGCTTHTLLRRASCVGLSWAAPPTFKSYVFIQETVVSPYRLKQGGRIKVIKLAPVCRTDREAVLGGRESLLNYFRCELISIWSWPKTVGIGSQPLAVVLRFKQKYIQLHKVHFKKYPFTLLFIVMEVDGLPTLPSRTGPCGLSSPGCATNSEPFGDADSRMKSQCDSKVLSLAEY